MEYIKYLTTPLGQVLLSSDGEALTGLWFDGQKHFAANLPAEHEEQQVSVFEQAESWLNQYFSGCAPDITLPLSPRGTPFQKLVWDILLTVPFGKTTTYGQIASILAERRGLTRFSAQSVGNAVGHNPISLIIPCHRVVGANGNLVGYAGGLSKKEQLLIMEGALPHIKAQTSQ